MTRPPAFSSSYGYARYFVRYRDGMESGAMPKDIAKSYANMFGVTVHLDRNIPPKPWLLPALKLGGSLVLALGLGILLLYEAFKT